VVCAGLSFLQTPQLKGGFMSS